MFLENHKGAVEAVNTHFRGVASVHGNATYLSHISKGQNIGDGFLVVPHGGKVWEVADHVGILISSVCQSAESVWAAADVG